MRRKCERIIKKFRMCPGRCDPPGDPRHPEPSTSFQTRRLTFRADIRDDPFPDLGRPKSWNPRARRRMTRSVTVVCSSHPPPRVIPPATGSAVRVPPRFRPSPPRHIAPPRPIRGWLGGAEARAAVFSVPWRQCSEGCTSCAGDGATRTTRTRRPRWRRRTRCLEPREYLRSWLRCAVTRANVRRWAPSTKSQHRHAAAGRRRASSFTAGGYPAQNHARALFSMGDARGVKRPAASDEDVGVRDV